MSYPQKALGALRLPTVADSIPDTVHSATVKKFVALAAVWLIGIDALDEVAHLGIATSGSFHFASDIVLICGALGLFSPQLYRLAEHRRQATATLRQAQRLIDSVFLTSKLVHLAVQADEGRIVAANPAAADFYGWPLTDLLRLTVSDIDPTPPDELRERLERAFAEKKAVVTTTNRLASGATRQVEVFVEPFWLNGTKFLLATVIDITAQLQAKQELQHTEKLLRASLASVRAIAKGEDRSTLAAHVVRALVEEAGYVAACIAEVPDAPDAPLHCMAQLGKETDFIDQYVSAWNEPSSGCSITATAIRTRTAQISHGFEHCDSCSPWRCAAKEAGVRSKISIPLVFAGRSREALTVFSSDADAFGDAEVQTLSLLAGDMARTFCSIDSVQRVHQAEADLKQALTATDNALMGTVAALAGAIEVRDPYTAGHQQRVAQLACAIGARMGMSEFQLRGLRVGALLHDVGKVGVPAELMVKPGKLNEEELALIRTHTTRGTQVLSKVQFPWPVREIVVQHHERLDGSGYPAQLKGDQICLEARVVAVADIVESMLMSRPYRLAMGWDAAQQELIRGRGITLDPQAVDTCMEIIGKQGTAFFSIDG